MITRDNVEALIPEDASQEIFQDIAGASNALRLMRRLPNMTRGQRRLAVMSALPMVYFVDGTPGEAGLSGDPNKDGFKRQTGAEWENKYIHAEEMAAIIPISISTLEDSDYDIWEELRPHIADAFGKVIDLAILFGIDAPALWPDGIVLDAMSAGNSVVLGTGTDLYDDIMGEEGLIALVEEDGFFPTGFVAGIPMRGKLRGLRSPVEGLPLFRAMTGGMQSATPYTLDGVPVEFPLNGGWDDTQALMVAGDWSRAVYAIRKDLTYKVLDQAIIQDPTTGEIIYNLAQQDMVALRMYMRLGWQLPNPVNRVNPDEITRYPFSVLVPATSP